MQGIGNDFVVLDRSELGSRDPHELVRRLCARRTDVGADGMLVLQREYDTSHFRMTMYNADGTEDMCGNGLRCASLWALNAGWIRAENSFTAATLVGQRIGRIRSVVQNGKRAEVSISMGMPHFDSRDLPAHGLDRSALFETELNVRGRTFNIASVNTGSTHTVIFGRPPEDPLFALISQGIEEHHLFPDRTSIMWAEYMGHHQFNIRIWERGVGETLGCGTGACAVAVVARRKGIVDLQPVRVVSPGGVLEIRWSSSRSDILMTGPAVLVYDGTVN